MSTAFITPHPLSGTITAPPSKSVAHRALICAVLSGGKCVIKNCPENDDIKATVECLKNIGADIIAKGNMITVNGFKPLKTADIFCNESGSTLRFLLPVISALGIEASFSGAGRLPERPIKILTEIIREHSVKCSADFLPLKISGKLSGGEFFIPGNISSQYITGLLLAAPLFNYDTKITLTSPLQSASYIDITLSVMKKFGVTVEKTDDGFFIDSLSSYNPTDLYIEGDWSSAAFFLSSAAIGGKVKINGLDINSAQGDRQIINLLSRFGAFVEPTENGAEVFSDHLNGINIDASDIPDLVPVLSVVGAFAKGKTIIYNAERLRLKESDRLSEVTKRLKAMGVEVNEGKDYIEINGGFPHCAQFNSANDHRIVMSFSIAAAYAIGESKIDGTEAINKSYSSFFKDFKVLGGVINVW